MISKIILLFTLTTSVFEARKLLPWHHFPYVNDQIESWNDDENRIVGGQPAAIGEFPYQAALRAVILGVPYCGGTIITQKHVLTAAQCFPPEIPFELVYVYVGSNQLSTGGASYLIDHVKVHEDYFRNATKIINDIAIVTLMTEILFDSVTQPAVLPFYPPESDEGAEVSGWGRTKRNESGSKPDYLMKLSYYKIFDLDECVKVLHDDPIHYGKICAIGTFGTGPCQGDFGGPLSVRGTVIGIASYFNGQAPCASGYPDVFTNVFFYLRWIILNTRPYSDNVFFVGK